MTKSTKTVLLIYIMFSVPNISLKYFGSKLKRPCVHETGMKVFFSLILVKGISYIHQAIFMSSV